MGTRCPFCHKNLWVMIDEAWQYPVTFCRGCGALLLEEEDGQMQS